MPASAAKRLIDEPVLNSVIVLMVVTSALGPILTEVIGRRMAGLQSESRPPKRQADVPVAA